MSKDLLALKKAKKFKFQFSKLFLWGQAVESPAQGWALTAMGCTGTEVYNSIATELLQPKQITQGLTTPFYWWGLRYAEIK